MNDSERRMAEAKRRIAEGQAKLRRDAEQRRQQSDRLRKESERKSREQKQLSEKHRRESEQRQARALDEARRRQDKAEADAARRDDQRRQQRWHDEERADRQKSERQRAQAAASTPRNRSESSSGASPYVGQRESGGGCFKQLLTLAVIGSLLWWQWNTIAPLVKTLVAKVNSLVVDSKIEQELTHKRLPVGSSTKPQIERPSTLSDSLNSTSTPPLTEINPADLSFSAMLAVGNVEKAVQKALKHGEPKRWRDKRRTGYALVSQVANLKDQECRSVYISEHVGREDKLTEAVTYCRFDDAWSRQ